MFGKTGFALRLMNPRFRRLRLSQKAFAERFGVPMGTIKEVEQMRCNGSAALHVLVEPIAHDPELAARAAENAKASLVRRAPIKRRETSFNGTPKSDPLLRLNSNNRYSEQRSYHC